MMKTLISIKKCRGLTIASQERVVAGSIIGRFDNRNLAATLQARLMSFGYILSEPLFNAIAGLPSHRIADLAKDVTNVVKTLKGANVKHEPMYPNFPEQVMDASDLELFLNAVCHYWTGGNWLPEYEKLPRSFALENVDFISLKLVSENDFQAVLANLLASNDSLSEEDKTIIEWFLEHLPNAPLPETIPFKETMCVVAGMFIKKGRDISGLIKTATDILRVVTYLNGGDVSLATNTKFKSMPRSQRKMFAQLLEKVASAEDINRHRNKWVRLFHNLHIGDYSPSLFAMAKRIRNNQNIETFNSKVEQKIKHGLLDPLLTLLTSRPGEFARRLDHLLRRFPEKQAQILDQFWSVTKELPARITVQLLGHFLNRNAAETTGRLVFPKGKTQKAQKIVGHPAFNDKLNATLTTGLQSSLKARFAALDSLGKVWIDPALKYCPVPTQQRSASPGLVNVARGTHLPIQNREKNTLRFFIHWVGQDLDLSATLYDKDFELIEQVSYTNLRSGKYQACHSGDKITAPAPHGASEFIDINIDEAARAGARYLSMNVFVFRGEEFAKHSVCFAGWMTRSAPNSNEIFEAKTVEQKIDLRAESKISIPVVFDLVERKAIWCDLSKDGRQRYYQPYGGNNVHSNAASIKETLKSIVECHGKLNLYELFQLHAQARGQVVSTKEEADQIFSLKEGVTPFDINKITAEFLA